MSKTITKHNTHTNKKYYECNFIGHPVFISTLFLLRSFVLVWDTRYSMYLILVGVTTPSVSFLLVKIWEIHKKTKQKIKHFSDKHFEIITNYSFESIDNLTVII